MAVQPSASWKLRAMSMPFEGSVHTIRVSKIEYEYMLICEAKVKVWRIPCCFWKPSSLQILVSSSNRFG